MRTVLYLCGLILAVAAGYGLKPDRQASSSCPPVEAASNAPAASETAAPAIIAQEQPAPEPPVNAPAAGDDKSQDTADRIKRIADAFASSPDFTAISPSDLSVQTHKWDMKLVQVDLSCFYADVGDFRCTGPRSRVDFDALYPESEAKMIERDCDTIAKSQSRKCRRTIRFSYEGFHEMDVGGFYGKLTVAQAGLNIGVIVPARSQSKAKGSGR